MEYDEKEEDVYSDHLDNLLEDDELSSSELGFMSGYNNAWSIPYKEPIGSWQLQLSKDSCSYKAKKGGATLIQNNLVVNEDEVLYGENLDYVAKKMSIRYMPYSSTD